MKKNNAIILYKIKSGSHLYGLTTPSSDIDYTGVCIDDSFEDFISPFANRDEIDLSVKSKLDNGKNDSNAIDEKYFHIKKFIRLCADNNPNILEMLFAPPSCIDIIDMPFKRSILDHPEYFVNKKLIDRFIGYAKSQEQKSYTKSGNYLLLKRFKNFLEPLIARYSNSPISWLLLPAGDLNFHENFKSDEYSILTKKHSETNLENYLILGDIEFSFNLGLKQALQYINNRFNQASHRIEEIFIRKYEPKFMSHTVRLLSEGIQLLKTGRIEFPFTGKDYEVIMNIKTGKTPIEQIPEIVNRYKDELSSLEKTITLPDTADFNEINEAYASLISHIYGLY